MTAVFLGVVLLAFRLHQETREKVLSQFNKQQLMIAQLTATQVESYFNGRSRDVRYLSSLTSMQHFDVKTIPSDVQAYLERLRKAHITEIHVLDGKGKVVFSTSGDTPGSKITGSEVYAWASRPENKGKVRLVMEKPDMRDRPAAGKGLKPPSPRLFIVSPIYHGDAAGGRSGPGGEFAGFLFLTVDLGNMLAERILVSTPKMALRNVWIMDMDGVLLLQSEHPEMVSSDVRKTGKECSRCHGSFNHIEKIAAERQGTVEYQVKGYPKKVAAFTPMKFGDTSWIVVVNASYDEVTGFIGRNIRDTLGLLVIVVLSMGLTANFLYRNYRKRLVIEEEVRHLTEKQVLMDELRETRDYLENLFDFANAPTVVCDPEFRITRVNRAFARLTGRRAEEVLGSPLESYFPADRREESMAHISKTIAGERLDAVEVPILRSDGVVRTVLWNSATLNAADGRTVIATIAQGQDITGRKKAEEALKASESKYRLLVETASEAIFIAQDGVIKFSNSLTSRITGYSGEELASMPFVTLVHPDDRQLVGERHERRLLEEDLPGPYSLRIRNKAGEELWIQLNAALIPWEGRPATLNFARDITHQRNLESQLLSSQKMEVVGRLAGGVAHDFNNLLTVILGYAEVLNVRFPAGDPSHKEVEEIRKAAEHAAEFTRQLLAFSRKQILQPRVININSVVSGMDRMLRRLIGENIGVVVKMDDGLWNVKADPGQVEQVVMNLTVNARDAMPGGGILTIETSNVLLDEEYANRHLPVQPGPHVMLAISDTGVGMDEETASKIFEPFFTTKERGKGTGLGLSTVYGIVKQSGGAIWVYTEPGVGSTFKVYLPRTEERVEDPPREVPPVADLRGVKTILVAEDDESIRKLAVEILGQYGYTVLSAGDGEEAIRVAGAHEGKIGLLLSDVVMPRMGGVELYRRLQQARPGIKVIYMSGYTDNAIVHQGVLDPCTAFLQKPFSPIGLARKVKEVLQA